MVYQNGNKEIKCVAKKQVGIYQFDLCDECLGNIAMNIYGMTKYMQIYDE